MEKSSFSGRGGDKHTRDELVSAALGSLDRALLERVLFRCGSFEGDGGDELIDEAVALATDEGVDFVLAIGDADTAGFARELARQVNATPGMRAVLTRNSDYFIPLPERPRIARKVGADIFISVHADAAENRSAGGSSVYVLSTRGASSQRARWLADK